MGGIILGASVNHLPSDPDVVSPSNKPGHGTWQLSMCGMVQGGVYESSMGQGRRMCRRCLLRHSEALESPVRLAYDGTLELAHLLALLKDAADLLDENGRDVDANIVRAHAGQLAAGREWPGMPIRSTIDFEGGP